MQSADEILANYNPKKKTGRKKRTIIKWFLSKPGERFDTSEVNSALGEELGIGEGQIRNYLEDLTEENVLCSYGGQRKAYQLNDEILIPVKYRVKAALKHLSATFDPSRWGYASVIVVSAMIWGALTMPFWLLWVALVVLPGDAYGTIGQGELFTLSVAMTFWLVIFGLTSYILYGFETWRRG